jgi:hypothetical protein
MQAVRPLDYDNPNTDAGGKEQRVLKRAAKESKENVHEIAAPSYVFVILGIFILWTIVIYVFILSELAGMDYLVSVYRNFFIVFLTLTSILVIASSVIVFGRLMDLKRVDVIIYNYELSLALWKFWCLIVAYWIFSTYGIFKVWELKERHGNEGYGAGRPISATEKGFVIRIHDPQDRLSIYVNSELTLQIFYIYGLAIALITACQTLYVQYKI